MAIASISAALTQFVGDYGLYAVFLLMLIDAVFPAGSEIVMVYGGAIASGAIAGTSVQLLGHTFPAGLSAYLAIALAGTFGYLIGAIIGWEIGIRGGRPLLAHHGRWFHLNEEKLDRAEAWFQRWEGWAVLLGRLTPVIRSFVSIPAGIFEVPFRRYVLLTLIGSAIWAFVFAGAGWAAGASWESVDHAFHFADYAIAILLVVVAAWIGWRFLKRRRSRGAG